MADIEIGWRRQASTETRPWRVDFTLAMDSGDAIASAATTLTDLLTGAAFAAGLSGSPAPSTVFVTQAVTALVPGRNYRLVYSANMGGSKVSSVGLNLECPW